MTLLLRTPALRRRTLLMGAGLPTAPASVDAMAAALQAEQPKAAHTMPAIFIGHGSPLNAIQDNAFTRHLSAWGTRLPRPSAILVVSAHWQTPGQTLVDTQARPRTIHDFGGFPAELHEMQYPAAGSPETAGRAVTLLEDFSAKSSTEWGLDHGTWTVLHHLFPRADVPVFQVSIDYGKPGQFHHDVGRRLAALRDRGVLIVGSGNLVHNLRATVRGAPEGPTAAAPWAQSFDDRVKEARAARDDAALLRYEGLDASARMAVPTPDHYWPLLYVLGAAAPKESAQTTYASFQAGTLSMRCLQFGA